MNAERANLVIVDRFKRDLFKYTYDEQKKEDAIKIWKLESGLAGYVAISGHSLFIENLNEDSRFNKELDDPRGIYRKIDN